MPKLLIWLVIVLVWVISDGIVNEIVGLHLSGWRRWVYALPSYAAGIAIGHYLIR